MAGIKISALPAAAAANLTDIFPVVQGGVTSKETLQQVLTLFNSAIQLNSTSQVTGLTTALGSFLPLAGGTMTGNLILNGNPTSANQAANKAYVDAVAQGFTVVLACQAATTGNLTAVYANGAAGVGATLTNSGAMAAFAVDGYSASSGDRILVKNQTTTFQNGIYTVTTVGSGAVNWVLTRATDYDQAPAEIKPGTLVLVNVGTVNATTSWLETATVTTIGTDPILFSQFTSSPSAFLLAANNLSDVANAATSRTNLGLGQAAVKSVSDNSKASVASVFGATTINDIAIFSDITGTVEDSGVLITGVVRTVKTQRITAVGAFTYTPSTNMLYCDIELQAGGAGGGGVSGAVSQFAAASGGGGGAYMRIRASAAQIGASANGIVGAKGNGGAAGANNGNDGTLTSITISGSTWTSGPGIKGLGCASSAVAQNILGGAGGTNTTAANATLLDDIPGQVGGYGTTSNFAGSGMIFSLNGGNSHKGYGGAGSSSSATISVAGSNGSGKGSGGSGATTANHNVTAKGGDGTDGLVIITEYCGS